LKPRAPLLARSQHRLVAQKPVTHCQSYPGSVGEPPLIAIPGASFLVQFPAWRNEAASKRRFCAWSSSVLKPDEPVRQWLKSLDRADRKAVGEDVKTAQYGWPLGMPLIRKLAPGLWEVRSHLAQGVPPSDLRTARQRLAALGKE
jgi:hypothetical protein